MNRFKSAMDALSDFMTDRFAPVANRITGNPWVKSLQDAVMGIVPMILVGSFITLVSILGTVVPGVPDLTMINQFSFGVMGLLVAFLLPYYVMHHKGLDDRRLVAGMTGLATFLMIIGPTFSDDGVTISYTFERFGPTGMFSAIVSGLFVGLVFVLFAKLKMFKESAMPDFLIVWFASLLPILASLLVAWVCTSVLGWDVYAAIAVVFSPLIAIGQSFAGFVLIYFVISFLYSFGLSTWLLWGLVYPILLQGIQDNMAAVAAGNAPTAINTVETITAWVAIGGWGATLPLGIMMLVAAKSSRLKAIGKATIVPSIFNINEPIVFGAPVVFNPTLMIPFWLNSLILPAITYGALASGLVGIPSQLFQLGYIPMPILTWLIQPGLMSLLLFAVNFAVASVLWWPFFRSYDKQAAIEDEAEDADESPATEGAAA